MSKHSILVVGGAGFIGSHTVVELFESGYQPIIVDNFSNAQRSAVDGINEICGQKIKIYEGDACDESFMKSVFEREKDIKGAVHFAAFKAVEESVKEPLKYYTNNLGSLQVLLSCILEYGVPWFVFSSSATVYGDTQQCPVDENTPVQPAESPYGTTKLFSEQIIEDVVKSGGGLNAIALRYFNPIGAHSSSKIGELPLGKPNNLVPFVTQTAAGIIDQLTVFGDDYNTEDGTCIRDYIHIVDLAKAHVKALDYIQSTDQQGMYDVINIGTGKGNSVLEVLNTFEEVTGQKINYVIGDRRDGDVASLYADVSKAEKILGWKSELTLDVALKDSWNWQQSLATK